MRTRRIPRYAAESVIARANEMARAVELAFPLRASGTDRAGLAHNGREERWQAIGRAGEHSVLVVAHVVRLREDEDIIRIISARYALRHERQRYESQTH